MRMMQQYGFVLSNGNPADRVAFSALDTERCGSEDIDVPSSPPSHWYMQGLFICTCTCLRMATMLIVSMTDIPVAAKIALHRENMSCWVAYSRVWGALSIQHLEAVLGDMTFVDMMGGRLPYLVAAMKSLPLREDSLPANTTLAERRLVEHLIIDCSKQLEGNLPLAKQLGTFSVSHPESDL